MSLEPDQRYNEANLPASDDYETLRMLLQAVTSASSGQASVAALYERLQQRYGLLAMTLERSTDSATRTDPYGEAAEIALLAREESLLPEARRVRICQLDALNASAGRILFLFPADCLLPEGLLDSLTSQVGIKFRLDMVSQQVEQAEMRARQRISEVATIYEIGQAIDPGDLTRLMQMITDRTALLMDAQACSLLLVDRESGRLRLAASHGLSLEFSQVEQKLGEGIAGRVALTEQPMLIVDSEADPRLEGVTLKPEIGSAIVVPMKDQTGAVVGVLSIRRRRPAPDFTTDDLKLFSVFATQGALALSSMRLYEDLRSRAAELSKLSTLSRSLISTTNLEHLMERVVEEVREVLAFERCCLYLRDAMRPVYMPRVWRGYSDAIGRNPVREGEGVVGQAAKSGKMILFDSKDPVGPERERERSFLQLKGYARSLGTDSFVAMPIFNGHGRCIAVLVADNRGRREPISQEQQNLLSAFVNQVGIAIDNSQLYAQMQDTLANIRRLKEYTERVLQSIGVAILSTDGRGILVRWNPAAEATLHLPAAAFEGTRLENLLERMRLPVEESRHLMELILKVQETGENLPRLRLTLHPEGRSPMTIYLMISRLSDQNQERAGVALIVEDVTQEERMQAELEKIRRLADIGQLAAKMAHEVRNALSPIRGAAQIIRGDLEAQSASIEWTEIIVAEVDGLSRLTSEMLDFARPTQLALRLLDLNEFVVSSLQTLNSFLSGCCVTVEWDLAPQMPSLQGDPVQLGQVIRNLSMNAAQSMPQGGSLRIVTRYEAPSDLFVLEFHDCGEGIAVQDLERIFRPFVTTRTKGTGLGLPIVQKVVDQHGGRVEVESRLHQGTCFRVLLPSSPPQDLITRSQEDMPLISRAPVGKFPDK